MHAELQRANTWLPTSASQKGVCTSDSSSGWSCCQLPSWGRLPLTKSWSPSCSVQSLHAVPACNYA